MKRGAILAILLSVPIVLWGQRAELNGRKVVVAVYTESKITIDGELNEPAWQTVEPAQDFIQRAPAEGQPASERSEVRVLYDKEYLYIGAYLYDSRPDLIEVNDISRDSQPGQQDNFGVVLDTFQDRRNGYVLSTSPYGSQRDTQFFNEGRDANRNWDAVWYVETRIHKDGWTAEYAIPFKSLRFNRDQAQHWGAQFFRLVRRNNESSSWMPVPSRFTNWSQQISYGGDLHGLEGVQPGRNFKVKPFVLAGINRFASRGKGTEGDFDGGLDVKYGLTSGLTLDLTANTDFSQVEADTQQVNLTRFPLFFPEKREFFLENTGIFQLGESYRFTVGGTSRSNEAILFHSRRIGLTREGLPLPILGGGRVTGRAGPYYLGFLNIQTRSEGAIPANNFTVARVRRNLLANSDVGVLFVNRQSQQERDYNRSFGADVHLLFFRRQLRTNAVLAKTDTPGRQGQDWLRKAEGMWDDGFLRLLGSYLEIQRNFNPEVGFVRRPGRKILHHEMGLRFFQGRGSRLGSWIREISPHVSSDYIILPGGATETKELLPKLRVDFQDASFIQVQYTQNFERLSRPFAIHRNFSIPIGDYRFNEFEVAYSSDDSDDWGGDLVYRSGGFYNGTKRTVIAGGRFRPNFHFSTSVSYEVNDIELRQGSFATHLVGLRIDYGFNPRTFLNTFFQYNSETNQISSNIRFRLIHHPLSDLYVVYNEVRDRRQNLHDRELTLKYTHLLNF
ncbi:MAG: carbohydrate binding family 9 domain-containing protein [Acidobacteria bacterium]|nr:carbohydrate binding family 9 domain-containing protein [Acidobacteriota bacterium]